MLEKLKVSFYLSIPVWETGAIPHVSLIPKPCVVSRYKNLNYWVGGWAGKFKSLLFLFVSMFAYGSSKAATQGLLSQTQFPVHKLTIKIAQAK